MDATRVLGSRNPPRGPTLPTHASELGRLRFAQEAGLWIAPAANDVTHVLEELNLLDCVSIFRGEAVTPTEPAQIISEAWDVDSLADGYRKFLERWEAGTFDNLDVVPRQILLHAEWLLLIREDPRLPLVLLPHERPGVRAQQMFPTLRHKEATAAHVRAESILDAVSTDRFRDGTVDTSA